LVQILVCLLTLAYSDAAIEIVLHPNCTGVESPCLTLSSLTAPVTPNVTLILLAGEHEVPSSIIFRWNHWTIKARGGKATLACGPVNINAYNIKFWRNSYAAISDVVFSHCKVHFEETNNTIINNSVVFSRINGKFEFSRCYNVSIDQTSFRDKTYESWSIIFFTNTIGLKVTRSKFMNLAISNNRAVIEISSSSGMIKCCNFTNNSVYDSDSGIISIYHGSQIYISNTTFSNNKVSPRYGSSSIIILFNINNVIIVSSVFRNNNARSYSASVIRINGYIPSLTLLATQFINNAGPLVSYSNSGTVIAECSDIAVQRTSTTVTHSHKELCAHHTPGVTATCKTFKCDGKSYQ